MQVLAVIGDIKVWVTGRVRKVGKIRRFKKVRRFRKTRKFREAGNKNRQACPDTFRAVYGMCGHRRCIY
jgi:hypothetical protein